MTKYVYTFGDGKAEGGAEMKNLLGGKGANLAEMNLIGVPVPPGFTITTEVCTISSKLLRHKSGSYYARAFAGGKEVWNRSRPTAFLWRRLSSLSSSTAPGIAASSKARQKLEYA